MFTPIICVAIAIELNCLRDGNNVTMRSTTKAKQFVNEVESISFPIDSLLAGVNDTCGYRRSLISRATLIHNRKGQKSGGELNPNLRSRSYWGRRQQS